MVKSAWPPSRIALLLRIGNRKPEITYLGIGLLDPGFFRPEGRIFRGRRLNAHHGKVLCIHPNSAAIEKLVFGEGFDGEDVARTGRHTLVPDQNEPVVIMVEGYVSLV